MIRGVQDFRISTTIHTMTHEKSKKSTGTHLWTSKHSKTTKIVVDLPVYDQWKDVESVEWAGKACAICSLKTILVFKDPSNADLNILKLIREGLELDGYLENAGWKHKVLIDIAGRHGVHLEFQKQFYAPEDKQKGLEFINKNLLKDRPVMTSIVNRNNSGGHIVVINGLEAR